MNKKSMVGLCVAAMALASCDGKTIPGNDLGFHYTADYSIKDVANYTAAAQDGYFLFYKKDGTSGILLTDDESPVNNAVYITPHQSAIHTFSGETPTFIQEKINAHQKKLAETGGADFDGTYVMKLSSEKPDLNTLGFRTFEIPGLDNVVCKARIQTAGTVQSMKCQ